MAKATINGVELFYDEHGSGEPVLIHHGYTGSHYSWDGVVPFLADRYRVFRMDARGAGDSSHPADGHTIEQYAADVIGMADHLGLDRFTYIGHSMGGVIGFELGLSHQDRLDKLVLVAPAPADGVVAPPAMHEASARLRAANDAEAMARQSIALSANPVSYEDALIDARRRLTISQAHFDQSWDALCTYRKGDRLGEITVPTLLVAGAADSLLAANLKDFQRLPNATLHVFSRVSHGIPYEIPETFAGVVADFLANGVVTAATLQENLRELSAAR
jgi:pimeloyl-ACP methyl ester carboxylesterase